MTTPRRKVESVSVPEADWVSVVPPNPPAALTARVYCTLAEPNRSAWARLAVPAGDMTVSPPSWVMAGAPPTGPGGGRGRRGIAPPPRGGGFAGFSPWATKQVETEPTGAPRG